jgi:hypothetical protein
MTPTEAKVTATSVIWVGITVIMITAMLTHVNVDGGLGVILGAFIIGGALFGTQAIWRSGTKEGEIERDEKSKRRSRVDQLIERLDERDIAELRARLTAPDDGEMTSLEDLLDSNSRR